MISESHPRRQVARRGFWLLAGTPFAWLVIFWFFVFRARVALGDWPRPSNPDPKDLGFSLHYWCLWVGVTVLYFAPLAMLVLAVRCKHHFKQRKLECFLGFVLLVAGATVFWCQFKFDPGRFISWWGGLKTTAINSLQLTPRRAVQRAPAGGGSRSHVARPSTMLAGRFSASTRLPGPLSSYR